MIESRPLEKIKADRLNPVTYSLFNARSVWEDGEENLWVSGPLWTTQNHFQDSLWNKSVGYSIYT